MIENYRVRSKKDRKIESVVDKLHCMVTLGLPPDLNSPKSPPGAAVKNLSEEQREILKEAKPKHFQNYPIRYNG